ncbi:MAG: LysM peptidoglycan-binding domain-containing protein [Myxococcaceae bacterium]|nr:LysM peptidoglycan-binding domain-containing protein [Myxococcaceae bacterium]
MRNRIIASLCTLLLWSPGLSLAQEDDQMEDGGENAGAEVAPAPQGGDEVRMAPKDEGQQVAPGEVHTVVKGDTLWDLSQTYLGSPWYWPKVWSYNPEIANPHWIYPGNKIRFFPAGEEVPSRVEVGTAPEAPETIEDTGEVEPSMMLEGEQGTVSTSGKIGYTPKGATAIILDAFVTAKELAEAGRIEGSFAETEMLSTPDTVYIRFKNKGAVKLGDSFVVYRTEKEVEHPITGKMLGYLTRLLGKVRVVSTSREYVTAQITDSWDEIHRGDLIGPANEELRLQVVRRRNEKALTGTIVELIQPYQTLAGEHQVVMVDRGSADGVEVGNTFTIVRRSDEGGADFMSPQYGQEAKWPDEPFAACMIIDTKDRVSSCLLTRSIREVYRGDQAIMKLEAGGSPTASR